VFPLNGLGGRQIRDKRVCQIALTMGKKAGLVVHKAVGIRRFIEFVLPLRSKGIEVSAYGLHTDGIAPKKKDSRLIVASPFLT
jgi:hypothetical protein